MKPETREQLAGAGEQRGSYYREGTVVRATREPEERKMVFSKGKNPPIQDFTSSENIL